jgi:hypothetical protein
MAPTSYETKDTILPIFNNDYFKHNHCPMRSGNVRCRCKSTCDRVDFGDHAGTEKAAMLRDQILAQIKPFKLEASMPDSHVWFDIETKVVMLVGWVLCKKHMSECSAAVRMTMRFLKQESGMFVEEQSAQPHSKKSTNINNLSFAGVGSSAPYSTYAPATSYLATPPMSPGTLSQGNAYYDHVPSHAVNTFSNRAPYSSPFQLPQQSQPVFHMRVPVKTEPYTEGYSADSRCDFSMQRKLFHELPEHVINATVYVHLFCPIFAMPRPT